MFGKTTYSGYFSPLGNEYNQAGWTSPGFSVGFPPPVGVRGAVIRA